MALGCSRDDGTGTTDMQGTEASRRRWCDTASVVAQLFKGVGRGMKARRHSPVESPEVGDGRSNCRSMVPGPRIASNSRHRVAYRKVLLHNEASCLGSCDLFEDSTLGVRQLPCCGARYVGSF